MFKGQKLILLLVRSNRRRLASESKRFGGLSATTAWLRATTTESQRVVVPVKAVLATTKHCTMATQDRVTWMSLVSMK